ncbi:MAG: hypothetical protein PWP08_1534 [Methanofollis sp.]|nr:hypothetical protein [Methanofollis sp.]
MARGPLTGGKKQEILGRRDRLDKMEKLSVQLRWLTEIGFADVDVVCELPRARVGVASCFILLLLRRVHGLKGAFRT